MPESCCKKRYGFLGKYDIIIFEKFLSKNTAGNRQALFFYAFLDHFQKMYSQNQAQKDSEST